MEDIEMQRNGLVWIIFDDGEVSLRKLFDRKLERLVQDMVHSMPIRMAGMHHLLVRFQGSQRRPSLLTLHVWPQLQISLPDIRCK
jgi:hypothetical protein